MTTRRSHDCGRGARGCARPDGRGRPRRPTSSLGGRAHAEAAARDEPAATAQPTCRDDRRRLRLRRPALEMGALVDGDARCPTAQVRIPLGDAQPARAGGRRDRHGKTKTLQVLAEQISATGRAVFAADIKGDLSGIAIARAAERQAAGADAERSARTGSRAAARPSTSPSAGWARACRCGRRSSSFGPLLLSKVLGLNETQESSLGLVFHYADRPGCRCSTSRTCGRCSPI